MAEPQLLDYIKKARQAGQADEQSRALLQKNGWTETEANDAFLAVNQSQARPQVQPQPQPQVQQQPKPQTQQQSKPQYRSPPAQSNLPKTKTGSHLALKFLIALIILTVVAVAGYFVMAQTNLLQNMLNVFSFSTIISPSPVVENNVKNQEPAPALTLATAKLATVLQDYDITKLTVYSFSKTGDEVAYCAPQKVGGKIDCFLNDQKLDNPYNYKPYWIGASPDGKRVISLYLDPATKQAFTFENGREGVRYDGTIAGSKFSDDSQSFSYVVSGKDNKSFVVLNGEASSPHDKIYGIPALSTDGKYILYGARDGQDLFWIADQVK